MASLYDNTQNIYRTDFRSLSVTDSGTFALPDDEAKQVQIFNDAAQVIRIYKTENETGNAYLSTISGTSNTDSVYLELEDGNTYDINGIGNANNISVQKKTYNAANFVLKYVISR
tara:strand:- start:857 stop:1201 length:345 start_codon:yes stop_codon:yes gene_type:complete